MKRHRFPKPKDTTPVAWVLVNFRTDNTFKVLADMQGTGPKWYLPHVKRSDHLQPSVAALIFFDLADAMTTLDVCRRHNHHANKGKLAVVTIATLMKRLAKLAPKKATERIVISDPAMKPVSSVVRPHQARVLAG